MCVICASYTPICVVCATVLWRNEHVDLLEKLAQNS
ncbi:hypothetical protein PSE_4395 [Pseudovibrio sp. FO-BEG1]|nr:hypothetical protein PSE_4395 [Pseudovibrio sp. FO-BEG1]